MPEYLISAYGFDLRMYNFDFNLQAARGITSISMDRGSNPQQSDLEKHGGYKEF